MEQMSVLYPSKFEHSDSSHGSSSGGNTTNEQYLFEVLGVPLEVLQEEMRTRATSSSFASSSISAPLSIPSPSEEEEILYCCTVGVSSRIDEKKLTSLRAWYQIQDDLNPRLAALSEWCCTPNLEVGIYEAYLLGGLRLCLNAFAREISHRLGICVNQLNPNAWRLIISMQVLWREVFDGNCPLTMDEFLYCYKLSKISQSLGFYQFFARGSSCRLVKSLPTSDRRWKTKFFFVLVF